MMSDWIDAHAHLTDPRLESELPRFLTEAADAGIEKYVLGGIEPEEWERQKKFARKYPGVAFLSFGLHPWWVASQSEVDPTVAGMARLHAELSAKPRLCHAIGETGLDFHPRFKEESHPLQERVFREHLRLGLARGLPLVLHVVRAHERALEILHEEQRDASRGQHPQNYRGIIHSFSGEPEIARSYLDLGLTPSVSAAVITRGKGAAFEKLRQTMVTLAATEFVLETDSPDQPPAGESGVNPPVNLIRVAEAVAEIRSAKFPGTTAESLLDQSSATVRSVFGIEN
jgi:TatD DNase family protein